MAKLAQLTGQSDPFGTVAKTPRPLQSRANVRPQYTPAGAEASAPTGWPQWMQRAPLEAPPQQEYEEPASQYHQSPVPPLHRYAAPPAAASEQDHHEPQDAGEQHGLIKSVEQENALDSAYPDDPYAHQRGFGRMVAVAVVLALALVGTGAALTYRAYVASPRGSELPIVRADNSATNVVPAQSDGGASKISDRIPPGYGGEKLASRDETSVDVDSSSGAPLVVSSAAEPERQPTAGYECFSDRPAGGGREWHRARQRAAQDQGARREGRAPPTLAPQSAPASDPAPPIRLAATSRVRTASSAGGDYLVQVSSQKNEADVQASYRALQHKFPAALGSRPPVIMRADLGAKGIHYRTMVGPFGSTEEAARFCGNLKSAGGRTSGSLISPGGKQRSGSSSSPACGSPIDR